MTQKYPPTNRTRVPTQIISNTLILFYLFVNIHGIFHFGKFFHPYARRPIYSSRMAFSTHNMATPVSAKIVFYLFGDLYGNKNEIIFDCFNNGIDCLSVRVRSASYSY